MKRLILILFALTVIVPTTNKASAQTEGEFRFGFRTGYYFGTNAYALGVYGNYGITDWLNIEPGVNYIAKQHSSVDVYCDFQVPLESTTYWYIYPIVGISVNDIYDHKGGVDKWAGGVNLGLGLSYEINDRWDVSLHGKWMGRFPIKHSNAVIAHISVGYNF